MSTQMKSFITTLDLVMQDKVDPDTVVEKDEIEETLTLDEDGELISEVAPVLGALARRAIAAVATLGNEAGAELNVSVSTGDDELPPDPRQGDGDVTDRSPNADEYSEALGELKRLSGDSKKSINEMMTRQHYELFAGVLADIEDVNKRQQNADMLIPIFAEDNPRFREEDFLIAANLLTDDDIAFNKEFAAAGKRIAQDAVGDDTTLTPFKHTNRENPTQMPPSGETETHGMVKIPVEGVVIRKKTSDDYQNALNGKPGYVVVESV